MHVFRPWLKHLQRFKRIGIKLWEESRTQDTYYFRGTDLGRKEGIAVTSFFFEKWGNNSEYNWFRALFPIKFTGTVLYRINKASFYIWITYISKKHIYRMLLGIILASDIK